MFVFLQSAFQPFAGQAVDCRKQNNFAITAIPILHLYQHVKIDAGHDFGTEIGIGRYDGFNGLLLKGDGAGGFTPLSILQSGIFIPGNGRALVKLRDPKGNYRVAASQNKNVLKLYRLRRESRSIPVDPADVSALIRFRNGRIQKEEFYYGSSFLSQSARFLQVDTTMSTITITDSRGNSRLVHL